MSSRSPAIIGRIITILGIDGRGWEPVESIPSQQDANGDTTVGPYPTPDDATLLPGAMGNSG